LWRGRMPFALKAAALATATLLATPYVYIYDFPILAVALAFLWRQREFDRRETLLAAIACAAVAAFPFAGIATGLAATLCVAGIVCVRTLETRREAPVIATPVQGVVS
jgi:arabinofuranan 3-O-arabinosyltransferase